MVYLGVVRVGATHGSYQQSAVSFFSAYCLPLLERRNSMSESRPRGGRSSMFLAVALWALVLVPLLWGVYQTLTGVVAQFSQL
jgi:hypothetical protein